MVPPQAESGRNACERGMGMEETSELLTGVMVAILGLVGLVLASGALDDEMYLFGFSLAGFAFAFDFMLIRRHYDRQDAQRAAVKAAVHHG
jgi:positive regulator of sigma E activity